MGRRCWHGEIYVSKCHPKCCDKAQRPLLGAHLGSGVHAHTVALGVLGLVWNRSRVDVCGAWCRKDQLKLEGHILNKSGAPTKCYPRTRESLTEGDFCLLKQSYQILKSQVQGKKGDNTGW